MHFEIPDPKLVRRSSCGGYLIEKEVEADGTSSYGVWRYVRSDWGFKTAAEAATHAKNLQSQFEAEYAARAARRAAEQAASGATTAPESRTASREPG